MPRNASGVYTVPVGTQAVTATPIDSSDYNAFLADLETEFTESLGTAGEAPMTAPLKGATGSAAAPSYTFSALTTAGLYKTSAGVGFSVGGTLRAELLSTGFQMSVAPVPATSDLVALGSATLMFSDLFLASGAVLNFNNGNYTVTHSAGLLTFSAAATFATTSTFTGVATFTAAPVFTAASTTRTNLGVAYASQAEQETATATDRVVAPGTQHFHPSAAKFWAITTGDGTPVLSASYNVTSITDTGTGQLTVTIATDFSSANWCAVATTTSTTARWAIINNTAAGTVLIDAKDNNNTLADVTAGFNVVGFGDQ